MRGLPGLEFMRGIPGTVGGFVRMNGGAYGREVADVLIDCDVMMPDGALVTLAAADLHYSYRHSQLPEGAVVVGARFQGQPGDPAEIGAKMDAIGDARENSQPLRTRTGARPSRTLPAARRGNWSMPPAAAACKWAARRSAKNTPISSSMSMMRPAPISKRWVKKCAAVSTRIRGSNSNGKSSASGGSRTGHDRTTQAPYRRADGRLGQ